MTSRQKREKGALWLKDPTKKKHQRPNLGCGKIGMEKEGRGKPKKRKVFEPDEKNRDLEGCYSILRVAGGGF